MDTRHNIFFSASQNMSEVADGSIDLVVTSPPYPMIEMWDDSFSRQNPQIAFELNEGNSGEAFELMHKELDKVWKECFRVIKDGGFLCINIGDATRTVRGVFQLYNSHSRITSACNTLGFSNLPNIIWRKQTNAPNKFMGSGMLPNGAYVTLEHEYILIFREGGKRLYKTDFDKNKRRKSSFFWEERNIWFSDLWDLKGIKQKINSDKSRNRSAAYPLELPYRLINMYSQCGDTVLDPFVGLGTTTLAAALLGRNSIGFEIDSSLRTIIENNILSFGIDTMNNNIISRYKRHLDFIGERAKTYGSTKYHNNYLNCDVITAQESDLELHFITSFDMIAETPLSFLCEYEEQSQMNNPPEPNTLFYRSGTL